MKRRDFLKAAIAGAIIPAILRGRSAAESHGEMPYRTLGRTGEKISVLGLGGSHIGKPVNEQESVRIIRTAIDNGINFMDNCWDYYAGQSEIRMGNALRDGYREKVLLMTKIDGRDKKTAEQQIDESLRRLQTDRIDLLQFHEVIWPSDPQRIFASDGAMEAALKARQAGKLRYIGFTGHKSPAIHFAMLQTAFNQGFTFDAVQMPLNVMDPHFQSFQKLVLPVLLEHNIGVLGMKPLGGGLILRGGIVSPAECLRYALSLPTSVVITGCDSMPVLHQALSIARSFRPVTEAEQVALLAKTAPFARNGEYELYKTTHQFDGTYWNPQWLG